MHLVHTTSISGGHSVEVHQKANGSFRVTYGSEVNDNLDYIRAAEHYGYSVFHALACAGQLTQENDDE